ncbi:MAG: valine--tRNA ligase [Pseudomonadota bacterium]
MDKTFNAAEAEARLYAAWEEAGCFSAGKHVENAETSAYCVMIPPPNVTGVLHMGHAFNNTLQDILTRWHRMRGFHTLWQPGTDHAGIATQMVVERQLMETQQPGRKELGREKFLEKVWEWKTQSGGTIRDQLKRLGASCDWSREAFTMSGAPGVPPELAKANEGNFHDAVIKVFVKMYEQGLIYRGKRLVNWDPHFETAISDLEVENIETPGHMWHFKYPLAGGATYEYVEKDDDGNVTLRETRDYISIATTRPETMLGDGAVAVHPSDERYAPIVGKYCEIPVGPKEHRRLIPIITDPYPDPDFGSGAVKITGAHDFNDYAVAKRGGIPMYRLMAFDGTMRADGAPYAEEAEKAQAHAKGAAFTENEADAINLVPDDLRGLDRFEARKRVVEQITAEGLAVMVEAPHAPDTDPGPPPAEGEVPGQARDELIPLVESKPIMQPFGDRSKVVIEPMLTDQWFVDTDKIVGPALDAVKNGDVKILPESGEKVYYHWLENIEPWCISRQLWWGHQIPVWYYPPLGWSDEDEKVAQKYVRRKPRSPTSDMANHVCASSFEDAKAQILHNLHHSVHRGTKVEILEGEPLAGHTGIWDTDDGVPAFYLHRDPDVLDTWFSSGLWPIGTLGWPEDSEELKRYFPTTDLITGQDILFFWVARMMMMQLAVVDDIPFKNVYLHGLVRDAKGKKMSKSTGNVVDPLDIVDEYGADALRFSSAAMAALGGVLKLDMERIKGYRNFGTKLWNAARFAEMNGALSARGAVYKTLNTGSANVQNSTNRWIIGETAKVREAVDEALAAYRFNDAASALYAFVWGKVCDWYVEFAKPLLSNEETAQETREVMTWVLEQCCILLHPIMPFITEELWAQTPRERMLAVTEWPTYGTDIVDKSADQEINWVITLIENIRSARAQMNVPASARIPLVAVDMDAAGAAALAAQWPLIERLARVEGPENTGEMPKGALVISAPGCTLGLPVADLIDVDAERARLTKSVGKLDKEIKGLEGRVNNPKFVASAPDDVVEEARANLAARKEERDTLSAAVERLEEMA